MSRGFENDTLEVFRVNVAVTISVEDMKSLPYPFALQASQHLRELRVCHVMAMLPPSNVQGRPFAVPIEWYRVVTLILVVQFLKVLILDCSRSFLVE